MSTLMLSETRERFLLAILAHVPADRIAEIHFFSPIKQGGVQSGVAVVVEGEVPVTPTVDDAAPGAPASDEAPIDDAPIDDAPIDAPLIDELQSVVPSAPARDARFVVHTARYRLILKGLDRGKWDASVAAEADAPLATVDAVVRGVQRRAGDVDNATRISGDDVRAFAERRAAISDQPAA